MRKKTGSIIAMLAVALLLFGTSLALFPLKAYAVTVNPASSGERPLVVPPPKDGRTRPLVVVVADNVGTETIDFVVPYAIVKESRTAEVVTVSTEPGAVKLMPALRVVADKTIAQFDASVPSGADIVIVPAVHRNENPALITWVSKQSAKGAVIVSICDGAWILARAGLLQEKVATAHWYSLASLQQQYPATAWMRNRRYVSQGKVMTTSGVTAALPASLALVEAIAGPEAASATAKRLGISEWGDGHDNAPFTLTTRRVILAITNWVAFWRHETLEVPVEDDFDEITTALIADAWSRTWRSEAVATSFAGVVRSRRGLNLIPDATPQPDRHRLVMQAAPPGDTLSAALKDIEGRYGAATADFVALQLELPK